MNKYGDSHAIERAMDFAWASAQLELRLLRIQPDDARRFQQLASHLLYPNPLLRSTLNALRKTARGRPDCGRMPSRVTCPLPWSPLTRRGI